MVLEGANGSGKTSLLRVLAGLLWPEAGEVRWEGQALDDDRAALGRRVSFLGHEQGLHADLTPAENAMFATQLRRRCAADEVREALAQVGMADTDRPTRALSAGQRRRVAMARVLLAKAPVWLLDEPWTHLDASGVRLCQDLIEAHAAHGGLVVLSAHYGVDFKSTRLRRLGLS